MINRPDTRWPNQRKAFDLTLAAFERGVKRLCVTSPTGTGKSVMIFDLLRWAKSEGKSAVLYTHRKMLFDQLVANLHREGIDFGKRASGHETATLRPIQIAMIQTELRKLATEERELHPADLVIIDEFHQFCSEKSQSVLDSHVAAGASIVGYTATPLDICGVDELLIAGVPSECRAFGALVPPVTFAPDEPDLKHIKKYTVGEDLSQADNHKAIMRPGIFGRVIKAWQRHNPNQKPTILFGPDVKGSLFFAEQFYKAGIPAAHIDGEDIWLNGEYLESSPDNRDLIREMSRSGEIKIVCNRFVLREGIDFPWVECLDEATEVLTTQGWKRRGEISEGDTIFNLNRKTGKIEVDTVKAATDRLVKEGERMVRIKSQHLDVRVTEGHTFWVKTDARKNEYANDRPWRKFAARDLLSRKAEITFPLTALPSESLFWQGIPLSDDEIRFIAWAVTDGWICKNTHAIQISQSKEYHNEIRSLLVRLGYTFHERIRSPSKTSYPTTRVSHEFTIPVGRQARVSGWKKLEPYIDKNGSPLWRMMSRRQFWVFWEELMKGDGQITTGTRKRYAALTINNEPLANLLHEMAVTRGYAGGLYQYTTPKGWRMFALRIRDSQWITTRPTDPRASTITAETPSPDEHVWCLTTTNGTLITRRNGKPLIVGNCMIFATVFGALTSFLQAGGRGLRAYAGKDKCLILDHGGNWHRGFGSLAEDRTWELGLTNHRVVGQRQDDYREKKQAEPIRCPSCGKVRNAGKTCPQCGFVAHKTARCVVQIDGTLKQVQGDVHRPRRVKQERDTAAKWQRMYYRAKSQKWSATFRQAEAMFFREEHYYPPRNLPLMPTDPADWFRKVADVPQRSLVPQPQNTNQQGSML